jgi:LCP family protein required for cell wall assembly
MNRQEIRNKKGKKKKAFYSIGVFFGLLILFLGGFILYIYNSAEETVEEAFEPIEASEKREEIVDLNKKDPISILLMGVDEREGDKGRADTLIMVTLNPNTESMFMFNIPRDTYTEIVGHGSSDKINHSYAFGGTEMTVKTVENFLDVPIDYYVKVNMEALSQIVDSLGGISVNNQIDWIDTGYYKKGYHYKKGEIELNGSKTLGFVRMRYEDPRGDLGRNERQRQVIDAIIKKGTNPVVITKLNNLFDVLGNNVKTNMTFENMKTIQSGYANSRNNRHSFEISGSGLTINGTWYYMISDEEKKRVSIKIKEHLEIN